MDKNRSLWGKMYRRFGKLRIVFVLIIFCLFFVESCFFYQGGVVSPFLSVIMIITAFAVMCGLVYLVYYNEFVYWDAAGYLSYHSYDTRRKKDKLRIVAKQYPILEYVIAILVCLLLLHGICGLLSKFYNFGYSYRSYDFLVWMPLYVTFCLCFTRERNLNFDKELNRFWRGGFANSVYDFEDGKYQDVTELQKIKGFSIVQNDGHYDLEMSLDDSKKIKLISNADEDYLKKIEGEIRKFLGCGDKSSGAC